jgi:hypothetical protein
MDITLKISVQFSDIKELVRTSKQETKIIFKNGDILTFNNGAGKRVFKNLCRNFPGEHLQ